MKTVMVWFRTTLILALTSKSSVAFAANDKPHLKNVARVPFGGASATMERIEPPNGNVGMETNLYASIADATVEVG
jgi:hypothetical protein